MPVLVFSSKNLASNTIANQLIPMGFQKAGEREWVRKGIRLIDCQADSILDIPTDFDTDCILVLSSHKMKTPKPMFTVHFPGNWNRADFGGTPRTLTQAHASRMKQLLLAIERHSQGGIGWPVNIETDHHGPTVGVPVIYVELGSSETEWGNAEAATVLAKAISDCIDTEERWPAAMGAGGGHYATAFHQWIKENPFAIGHIAPKYHLASLERDTFEQGIRKCVEEVRTVVVLKDETSAKDRQKLRKLCEEFRVEYRELK